MKKIYTLALAALAAFALTGCENDNMDNIKDNTHAEGSKVVFTAGLDAIARTAPAAGGVTTWTADDTIGVWDGTSYVEATIDNISGSTITFSAKVNPAATSYVAVTPADAWKGVDGEKVALNFATTQSVGKQVVAVANFEQGATEGTFRNVNNLLRFTVKKAAVKWAKLTGNKGEKFGTAVSVAPATGEGTATGEATELVVPITTGENFLALPQGVNLAEGFTITLYGDEALTDYQGEVCSKGAVTLARNQQRSLGTIDGWIDNWKLWEAGKSITIAGEEYSKTSTGVDGELLQTNGADFNFYTTNANGQQYIYGRTGTIVYFLEEVGDYKFMSSTFLNIGSASAEANIILCSRYDNALVTLDMAKDMRFQGGGSLMVKGLYYNIYDARTEHQYVTNYSSTVAINKLHFDNCHFEFSGASKYAFINISSTAKRGANSIKIVNSAIEVSGSREMHFFYHAGNLYWSDYKEIIFENNRIYSSTGKVGKIKLVSSNKVAPTSGTQQTDFTLNNNTFYNLQTQTMLSYDMNSMTAKNNIFCATASTGTCFIGDSPEATDEFPYTITGNVADSNNIIYYFNPNQPGPYKTLKAYVTKSGSASTYLKTIDVEKGIFEQTEAYKDKGAQKLF